MTHTFSRLRRFLAVAAIAAAIPALQAAAQSTPPDTSSSPLTPIQHGLVVRPKIGVQSIWFNGRYPVNDMLSPVLDTSAWGGGLTGSQNAVHLEAEIIPSSESLIRIPVSFDAFFLSGKTTFTFSNAPDPGLQRLTLRHTANLYSIGTGIRASFFRSPSLYLSAEGRLNIISPNTLEARLYNPDNDSTISGSTVTVHEETDIRGGAFLQIGTQVEFFDPLMLDFSIGYGALNLVGKETDPAKIHDLLVADNYQPNNRLRPSAERTVGYMGIAFGIIWKL